MKIDLNDSECCNEFESGYCILWFGRSKLDLNNSECCNEFELGFRILKAGEVFDSLAIPLMKLVGLKTSEMESEGRLSTFIFNTVSYVQSPS